MTSLFIDCRGTCASTILIAGTARSGTTWIGNVVARATRSREVFEPFLQDSRGDFVLLRKARPAHRDPQLYISPTETFSNQHFAPIERLLSGHVYAKWTDSETRIGIYWRRVVKEIRVNLFLGYIARMFPELKIIFVLRDPVAVVESQLACIADGWKFEWEPELVTEQPQLMADWLSPFLSLICSAKTPVEKQTLKWCVETFVAMNTIRGLENVKVVRYGKLVANSSDWEEIADFVGRDAWSKQRCLRAVQQRSRTTLLRSASPSISGHGGSFQRLNEEDRRVVAGLVADFGLSSIWQSCDGTIKDRGVREASHVDQGCSS